MVRFLSGKQQGNSLFAQKITTEPEQETKVRQPELFEYAKKHNILPAGYCPIGSPPDRKGTEQRRIRDFRQWQQRLKRIRYTLP